MSKNYLDFIEDQPELHGIVLTYENRCDNNFIDSWTNSQVLRIKVNERVLKFMIGVTSASTMDSFPKKLAYFLLHFCYLLKGSIIFFSKIRKADVILSNGAVVEGIFGYFLSKIMRKKLYIRWRTDLKFYLSAKLVSFFLRLSLKRAVSIAVNGNDIEVDLKNFLAKKKNVNVFTSNAAVDMETFFPTSQVKSRNKLNMPIDKFVILFAAPLNSTKFCDLIVSNAYEIIPRDSSFLYIFIGEGPLNKIVSKLEETFQQNVLFINHFVDLCTLNSYINASDITVGGADINYPGRLILESLACGTPVLLFDRSIHHQKRNIPLEFRIMLPHVFKVPYSVKDSINLLIVNKELIHDIKTDTGQTEISRRYISKYYEKYAVIKEEFKKFGLM